MCRRTLLGIVLVLVLAGSSARSAAAADAVARAPAAPVPPALRALLPDSAARGEYAAVAGTTYEIRGALATAHPCALDPYPLRVRIRVQAFADARAFEAGEPAATDDDLAATREEYERLIGVLAQNASSLIRVGPLRAEAGRRGSLLVFDELVDCSDRRRLERPNVWLHATARRALRRLTLDLEGVATAEEAVRLAHDILDRFAALPPAASGAP